MDGGAGVARHRGLGPGCGGGRPTAGEASSAGGRETRCQPWMSSPEYDWKKENEGETVKP